MFYLLAQPPCSPVPAKRAVCFSKANGRVLTHKEFPVSANQQSESSHPNEPLFSISQHIFAPVRLTYPNSLFFDYFASIRQARRELISQWLDQAKDNVAGACPVRPKSFFHSLKVGYIHGENFANRDVMRTAVFNYIECDDNRWGPLSACGGLSPAQFENQNLA